MSDVLPRQRPLHKARSRFLWWGVFAVAAALIVGPLLPLIYQSVTDRALYDTGEQFTVANFLNVISGKQFGAAALNSLIYAILATLISQSVGTLQAVLLARTNMPLRGLISALAIVPLFISPLVIAFGWHILYGPAGYVTSWIRDLAGMVPWVLQSMVGMALVGGVLNAPVAFLFCRGALALSDPSTEEAARICGASPFRTMRRVTLPMLWPAILFSGMINFTNALETLSIPLIFGEPAGIILLMPLLYKQAFGISRPDYGLVAAASLLFLAFVFVLLFIQSRMMGDTGRYLSVSGKAARKSLFDIGHLRWPAAVLVGGYVVAFIVLPMAAIFVRGFVSVLTPLIPIPEVLTTRNFETIIASATFRRAVMNSVIIAIVGGAITVAFAAAVALVCYRSDFWLRRQLEYVAMIPRAIPGMIAGVAFLYTVLLIPGVGFLRSTLVLFIVAYVGRFLPSALGSLYPSITKIGPDLDRSARLMGADWITASRRVIVPLLVPALFSAYILVMVQTMREYSMAIFLVSSGSEVISVLLLQAWAQGEVGLVAAMSVVQTIIIGMIVVGARVVMSGALGGGLTLRVARESSD